MKEQKLLIYTYSKMSVSVFNKQIVFVKSLLLSLHLSLLQTQTIPLKSNLINGHPFCHLSGPFQLNQNPFCSDFKPPFGQIQHPLLVH